MVPEIINKLYTIKKFVKSTIDTGNNELFHLEGNVTVKLPAAKQNFIIILEDGIWTDDHGNSVHSTNSYRIYLLPGNNLKIEHLRFGINNPFHLVNLKLLNGKWQNKVPHVCGTDKYFAEFLKKDSHLELNWKVIGNDKNYTIVTKYF